MIMHVLRFRDRIEIELVCVAEGMISAVFFTEQPAAFGLGFYGEKLYSSCFPYHTLVRFYYFY